jgi:two-component system NarL family sensor kinase
MLRQRNLAAHGRVTPDAQAPPSQYGLAPQLNRNEALANAVIQAFPEPFAIADQCGRIQFSNANWDALVGSGRAGPAPSEDDGRLLSTFGICSPSPAEGATAASQIRQVLSGSRRSVILMHRRIDSGKTRSFQTDIKGIDAFEGHVAIIHRDLDHLHDPQREADALCSAVLEARDHERKRIAQEIHDTTAQDLIASKLYLEMALAGITQNPQCYDAGARALELLEHSLRQIRTLSYVLHPPFLDELGMGATIRSYLKGFTERTGIQVASYVSAALPQLAPEILHAIFAILQEALTNVYRHSGRRAATVALYVVNDRLRLDISDYGQRKGRSPSNATHCVVPGVGIASMRTRAEQHGGTIAIHSAAQGTTVCVEFPVQ